MIRNRLAVWVAVVVAVGLAGCIRPDAASSSTTAAQQQQMDTLKNQISALQDQLRTQQQTPITVASSNGPTHADLRALETKIAKLEALQISNEEFQKLKLLADSQGKENQRLVAELSSLQSKYETLLADCAQRETRIQTLATARDEILAKISAQQSQMAALQNSIETRWAELFDKLTKQTFAAGSNPALEAELQRLRQEVQARVNELAQLTTQLAQSDDEVKKLRKRISDQAYQIKQLQDENERLTGATPNRPTNGETNVPPPVTSGALTGEILQVSVGQTIITSIVKFPPNTEFRANARFNVFNAAGEKIADFQVTSNNTPEQLAATEKWFGGIITPLKPNVVPAAKDRVTNLTSLPPINR